MAKVPPNSSDHKRVRVHQKLIMQVFVKRENVRENPQYRVLLLHIKLT